MPPSHKCHPIYELNWRKAPKSYTAYFQRFLEQYLLMQEWSSLPIIILFIYFWKAYSRKKDLHTRYIASQTISISWWKNAEVPEQNTKGSFINYDFEDFWPPSLLRWQVYYISLCSIVDIWLTPLFPLTRQRSLWMPLTINFNSRH